MKIASSDMALYSSNAAYSRYEKTEQLSIGLGRANGSGSPSAGINISKTEIQEKSFLSSLNEFKKHNRPSEIKKTADDLAKKLNNQNTPSVDSLSHSPQNIEDSFELSLKDKINLMLLIQLLQQFKKDPELMKSLGLNQLANGAAAPEDNQVDTLMLGVNTNSTPALRSPIQGTYSMKESYTEVESSQFSAIGQIKTADGKTINLAIELKMDRIVSQSQELSLRIGAVLKDPLVINLNGNAAEFSNERFSFDLSANGQKDLIPKLAAGHAFLAMDKNNDGLINNGSELFGPKSGDGFAELAQYDADKNGWIDENDAAFNDLKLWMNPGSDKPQLVDLKSAGVGAIYTGKAITTFHLNDKNAPEQGLGVIQSTGLFLKEDGQAGTVQHVDLAV